MPIYKGVRVKTDYSKMPHADFAVFVSAIHKRLRNNPNFPSPAVDLSALKTTLDEYRALVVAADDRSRTVLLQRNAVRRQLEALVRQLAHYVEAMSDNDPTVFATSGFVRLPDARASAEPLAPARILKIAHGSNSGQVRITLSPSLRKIRYYEVRYLVQGDAAVPAEWRTEIFTSANGPVRIDKLQPGKRYAFQVRGCGAAGFTGWSDSVMFICS